ncbi:MAG: hotdog fold thioesterase [Pseudomonadota bacterium]
MDERVRAAIFAAVKTEPFCREMGMDLLFLDDGRSIVEMDFVPERMRNIYGRAHGGAIFALIDEAFETSCQTDGTIAVALNVSVTYVAGPEAGCRLRAESNRVSQTRKTASFDIKVSEANGRLLAVCQALAYNTGKPIPFL